VWVGKERSKAAFEEFFTALGPRRAAAIEAISLDGSSVYLPVTREQIPQARHRKILGLLRRHRYRLWRTWELKEQLRDLYRIVDPAQARADLKRWCTCVKRSRIPAFTNLVRRIEKHFDAIVTAVELGLSNSRLEGINAKIRLIQRRGYGFRNLNSLTAQTYLCLGGITLNLPTER
jgi:transposase